MAPVGGRHRYRPDVARDDWRTVLADRRAPRRTDAGHRLVLLGTAGGSTPKATRAGYANAVVVGDAAYLVDCGEGAHRQLWRAGLTLNPTLGPERPLVRALFVTHLHADHVVDLVNLVLGSWPPPVLDVYGPAPAGLPSPCTRPTRSVRWCSPTGRRPASGPPWTTCSGPTPTTST
jgi:ribonuclease BN (tRNA processing enzyme)